MTNSLREHIAHVIGEQVQNLTPLSGGDISSVYKVGTRTQNYLVKIHTGSEAMGMFQSEKQALDYIKNTNSIAVPEVFYLSEFEGIAILVTEYVQSGSPRHEDWKKFGHDLAKLHSFTNEFFGWANDNFIGHLVQYNTPHTNWPEFYAHERLQVQLQLALQKNLLSADEIPSIDRLKEVCVTYLYDAKPQLIHGDLWGGNFLFDTLGKAWLIDPSVYFGHGLVDIAMSKLFGGFTPSFYDAYFEINPKPIYYKEQIDLYQLYYLLVHLNLFGRSYSTSVRNILKRYFL